MPYKNRELHKQSHSEYNKAYYQKNKSKILKRIKTYLDTGDNRQRHAQTLEKNANTTRPKPTASNYTTGA